MRELDLQPVRLQGRDSDFRSAAQAEQVGRIELDFGPRVGAGRNVVVSQQWRVDHACHPIGIAAFHGNLAIHDADAGDAVLLIVGILRPHGCAGASRENGRQNPTHRAKLHANHGGVLSNVR